MSDLPHNAVQPFAGSEKTKKEQVAEMFDKIAGRYDFMNRFLSARVDVAWRKKAIRMLRPFQPKTILDVATGTADMAITTYKMLQPEKIVGIDISENMLAVGRQKIAKEGLNEQIELLKGDGETINFPNNTFDASMVAFGIRNFENLQAGLSEMWRVLKPGGQLLVIEFATPKQPIKALYNFYMGSVAPWVAKRFRQSKEAYVYLNKSTNAFPDREELLAYFEKAGFEKLKYQSLSLGICCIYTAQKPPEK